MPRSAEASGIDLHLRAADLYRTLRRQGHTVRSTIDCLIAVLAEENGCAVIATSKPCLAAVCFGRGSCLSNLNGDE